MTVRPIDAAHVLNDINWHHKPTPVSEFESGFNQGLNQAMWIITHAPTLTQPNEWISVEDEIPSDDDDGLEFFCMTNATGKGGGVLPLEWEVATIRGKTVRRWRWLNRISPWTVTHWMKRPAPPEKENSHE